MQKHGKITYLGNRNPWTDRYKILHAGCRPERNHACQLLWGSVKGFGVAMGRILAFSIDLLRGLYNTLALPCECVIYCYHVSSTMQSAVHWRVVMLSTQTYYSHSIYSEERTRKSVYDGNDKKKLTTRPIGGFFSHNFIPVSYYSSAYIWLHGAVQIFHYYYYYCVKNVSCCAWDW